MRSLLLATACFVAAVVLGSLAWPEGELVRLHTWEAERVHDSTLWVVELDGHPWLRAGSPDAGWLARLRREPVVELARNGSRAAWRAVPVARPEARRAVNEAMARKYGVADRVVRALLGVEDAVPVRLDPVEGGRDEPPR